MDDSSGWSRMGEDGQEWFVVEVLDDPAFAVGNWNASACFEGVFLVALLTIL